MSGSAAALFRRELARLAAGRVFLAGGLFALLFMALPMIVVVSEYEAQGDALEKVAFLRTKAFDATQGYEVVMLLLVVFLGANQIGADVRAGTIFGILSRPVSRARLFLTGWAASSVTIFALELVRSGLLLGWAGWLEGRMHVLPVFGLIALCLGQLVVLAGFAALGAILPPAYAALAGFAALLAAGFGYSDEIGGLGAKLVNIVCWFIPMLSRQNELIEAAIQGTAQSSGPILEVIAYRACWTLLLLALGVYGIGRRDFAPRV